MRQEIIDKLRCSSCGGNFSVTFESAISENKKEIEYGTVKCGCGEFPIIDGILVTRRYPRLGKAVNSIKNARTKPALWNTALILIEEPYVRFIFRLSILIKRFFGKWPWLSFWKVTTFIKNSRYGTYLKYRFSCPSFISALAFLPAFKSVVNDGGLMLDLGSGVGHFDFMLARYIGADKLVCADKHFMNLYFARNYIVGSEASFICLDADEKIPFKDNIFNAILSMDAFHYIENKKSLADEFSRALKQDGALFFIHLHNRLVENMAKGLPLAPEEYSALFSGSNARFFPEKHLVSNVFKGIGIDMAGKMDMKDSNNSDAVSIVIAKNDGYFKGYGSYSTLKPVVGSGKMILNPLYMEVGGKYIRRFPSDFYEEEYYLIKEFFPQEISAETPHSELERKMVFIPSPENFMKKNERLYRFKLWR